MVSPISASDELGDMSNFFRVAPTNREQAQMAANFLLKTKHKKRIAILYDQTTSYGNSLKADFKDAISKKATIIGPANFTGGDFQTLQDALNNALGKNPDTIFFAGYVGDDLTRLSKDISSTPYANLPIVGGDTFADTNVYLKRLPQGLDHVYFTAFASPNEWDGTGHTPPFFKDYKTNFSMVTAPTGLPSIETNTMLGYDALSTLLYGSQQVLSKQNTINASDLTQALKQITVTNPLQGITGRIAFDSNGDQDKHKIILVEHIAGTKLVIDEKQGCLLKDNCGS